MKKIQIPLNKLKMIKVKTSRSLRSQFCHPTFKCFAILDLHPRSIIPPTCQLSQKISDPPVVNTSSALNVHGPLTDLLRH